MKTTYTGTMIIADLAKAVFEIELLSGCKYTDEDVEVIKKVEYRDVTSWDIIQGGDEAEEIEEHTDASGVDEFHEYLVLHFGNGETGTFRNSHVDMFIHRKEA